MTSRLRVLKIFFCFCFLALLAKLFYWQVYMGRQLAVAARAQYQTASEIQAPRGEILASDGSWLAASGEAWLVYASLRELTETPKAIAEKLAPLFLEEDSLIPSEDNQKQLLVELDRITTLLSRKDVVWVPLKHKIDPALKGKIEELGIAGIGFEKEERRVYPEGSVAAHLLGFVGKNKEGKDTGYFGLEGYYDIPLSGKPGYIRQEKDASGIPILLGEARQVQAVGGVSLITHIDKAVQLILDKKLAEGIEKYQASGGVAVVMQPKTGAIFAMSSYPSYDPGQYWKFRDSVFSNPVISSSFEPGSIFKVLVMAAALDSKTVAPDTVCDKCGGPVAVDKYLIETWNQVYHPGSTMLDVIVNSDNVGMVFVSQKIGVEKLYEYLKAFGLGEPTGIDLQGEASPPLREKDKWSTVDLATASFGQGIAVTPIQMLTAVAAIANRGEMLKPRVVEKIVGENWVEDFPPKSLGRVISEETARQITSMMVEAASRGESKWTNIPALNVAGKTGTAQIPIAGHYDAEKTIASFIGFAPYDDPKFVMLVTLDRPQSSPWASETAAPLWYSIAKELFLYFGIQPKN